MINDFLLIIIKMIFLIQDELRLAMDLIDESMNDNALNDLLKLVDVDKDGRINYEGKSIFCNLFVLMIQLI